MEHYAQNYIDPIKICSQNLEGLHRTDQKQLACSKPSDRRGPNRVFRETQCEDRGVTKYANCREMQAIGKRGWR
jgi:hypothetical protein